MITAELPGAHWSDTFTLDVPQGGLDAERAARLALDRIPVWAQVLMRLRNALVAPFGLKAAPDGTLPPEASIGTFPVISRAPDKVVLGLDDKHLDFRIVIEPARMIAIDSTKSGGTLVVAQTRYRHTERVADTHAEQRAEKLVLIGGAGHRIAPESP